MTFGGEGQPGHRHTEESKLKMRGRKNSDETKLKMRLAKLGKPRSKEMQDKLRKLRVGKAPWNKKSTTDQSLSIENG